MRPVGSRVACRLGRSLLRVEGRDAPKFLQNLITNDFSRLTQQRAIYGHFLNPQGRLLHDALVVNRTRSDMPSFLLDVPRQSGAPLLRHLQMYKMRQDVQVSDESTSHSVWAVITKQDNPLTLPETANDVTVFVDPRTALLGWRVLAPSTEDSPSWISSLQLETADESVYNLWRHLQGVGEGTDEMPTAGVLPLEANLEYLNGVSFEKGCYIGQELTARTHHTGVIRKRLMPCLLFPEATSLLSAMAIADAVQRELAASSNGPLIPPSLPNAPEGAPITSQPAR